MPLRIERQKLDELVLAFCNASCSLKNEAGLKVFGAVNQQQGEKLMLLALMHAQNNPYDLVLPEDVVEIGPEAFGLAKKAG